MDSLVFFKGSFPRKAIRFPEAPWKALVPQGNCWKCSLSLVLPCMCQESFITQLTEDSSKDVLWVIFHSPGSQNVSVSLSLKNQCYEVIFWKSLRWCKFVNTHLVRWHLPGLHLWKENTTFNTTDLYIYRTGKLNQESVSFRAPKLGSNAFPNGSRIGTIAKNTRNLSSDQQKLLWS